MRRLLCFFGLHSWSRNPDQLQTFGMGLEWFEHFTCHDCGAEMDWIRNCQKPLPRVWPNRNGDR